MATARPAAGNGRRPEWTARSGAVVRLRQPGWVRAVRRLARHQTRGGSVRERGDQARRRAEGAPGPERPRWPFLVAGGLVYAGALLGGGIGLVGEPDVSDLIAGSVAAVFSVGVGFFLSERGKMVPGLRAGDVRALATVPWQVVAESGQILALAARKAAGRPIGPVG